MPKTTRKYPTKHKTNTKKGRNSYMKLYMRDYRKTERELIRLARRFKLASN